MFIKDDIYIYFKKTPKQVFLLVLPVQISFPKISGRVRSKVFLRTEVGKIKVGRSLYKHLVGKGRRVVNYYFCFHSI